jgi:hypothetical protein
MRSGGLVLAGVPPVDVLHLCNRFQVCFIHGGPVRAGWATRTGLWIVAGVIELHAFGNWPMTMLPGDQMSATAAGGPVAVVVEGRADQSLPQWEMRPLVPSIFPVVRRRDMSTLSRSVTQRRKGHVRIAEGWHSQVIHDQETAPATIWHHF